MQTHQFNLYGVKLDMSVWTSKKVMTESFVFRCKNGTFMYDFLRPISTYRFYIPNIKLIGTCEFFISHEIILHCDPFQKFAFELPIFFLTYSKFRLQLGCMFWTVQQTLLSLFQTLIMDLVCWPWPLFQTSTVQILKIW